MEYLKVIAFTHHQIDLKSLGKLVICDQSLEDRLSTLKTELSISEIFYLGTCNRVEFVFLTQETTDKAYVKRFLNALHTGMPEEYMDEFIDKVSLFEAEEAFNHVLRTSCSLESLVVGEKEILAQMRKAYESCREAGFTGDYLRLIMDRVVKTAKEVYTFTNISKNPVSVVSLAYRKLKDLNIISNSRILIIGAGETNQNIAKYCIKHKFSNFAVFNRTLERAELLAKELGGQAYTLDALETYTKGFDVIITCTGATHSIINTTLYAQLLQGDTDKKVVLDLAVPTDVDPEVLEAFPVHYIEVESLKEIARKNIQERYNELVHAEKIIKDNILQFDTVLKQRRIEIAMQDVPRQIKAIKEKAMNGVFADEIGQLDEESRAVLEKVMCYMEKKCISVPMIMAKEILVGQV